MCSARSSRRERAVGVPRDHPVDDVRVVHGHPDVGLGRLLVAVGRRHRVKRHEELAHAPVVLAVRPRPPRADERAVVGVRHLEARRPVGRLHGLADAEARPVELARDLRVGVADRRVEERDVARVDAALERLEPVALLDALGDERVGLGQERPLELRQRRRRARGPHVGQDDPAPLLARIGDVADLRGEARLRRLARHLEAAAVGAELPAVVDAGHRQSSSTRPK